MTRDTTSHTPAAPVRSRIGVLGAALCAALTLDPASATFHAPRVFRRAPDRVAINDNRVPAGTLQNGVLTIRLEAREGEWHPNRDADPSLLVYAFGEEGQPLQIPGPLIRVPQGTEVRAFVRNSIPDSTLTVHGLYTRGDTDPTSDTIQVKPNEVREVRFVAGNAGTYYYWGATNGEPRLNRRRGAPSQLSGAIVVEPNGLALRPDRVLVMGLWFDSIAVGDSKVPVARLVINGKSWPSTERLTYQIGDTVRLRVINAGAATHPMHLHGFYFNVDSRGDERVDSIFGPLASPRLVVTERLATTRTFSLTWIPTRPGNWLFHCHDNVHIDRERPLDGRPLPTGAAHHVTNHAIEMMSGPVMGISVAGRAEEPPAAEATARRHLRLVARVDSGSSDSEPAFGFTLEDGRKTTPSAPPYLPGPTIVLKRGEPVSITVVNLLPEATAIHWHGIELDSYFDGVAGYSGDPGRITPPIAPRDSFNARFTPPRAGTFIYHTHVDEVRQMQAGLTGALLVVDAPETYDPATDRVMLVTVPRLRANNNVVLLNGSFTPAPQEMRVGATYRFRFINVHTSRPSLIMKVMRDSTVLRWRAIAKDGMDLPADQAMVQPAAQMMGNGEAYDFELRLATPGDIRIDVTASNGTLLVRMPIRVR